MLLHEDKTRFRELIGEASESLELPPSFIEKDYYVTLLLKRIAKDVPFIVFKGGTSLSKCFQVIKRFSEDIDISFGNGKVKESQGQRQSTNRAVREICQESNFGRCTLVNGFHSNGKLNTAVIEYDCLSDDDTVRNEIKIELSQFLPAYPARQMEVGSYIMDYLKKAGDLKAIEQFDLSSFPMFVQSLERTFVDKVFALCDYYLRERFDDNSRHIYDLYCIFPHVRKIENLHELVGEVRDLRMKLGEYAPSSQSENGIRELLDQIAAKKCFQRDYNHNTRKYLFEDVSYSKAVSVLSEIAGLDIW